MKIGVCLAFLALVATPVVGAVLPLIEPFGTNPWRDCNQDGHKGLGPLNLNPYRAELLLSHQVCPVQIQPPSGPPVPMYNDGRWVREQP